MSRPAVEFRLASPEAKRRRRDSPCARRLRATLSNRCVSGHRDDAQSQIGRRRGRRSAPPECHERRPPHGATRPRGRRQAPHGQRRESRRFTSRSVAAESCAGDDPNQGLPRRPRRGSLSAQPRKSREHPHTCLGRGSARTQRRRHSSCSAQRGAAPSDATAYSLRTRMPRRRSSRS